MKRSMFKGLAVVVAVAAGHASAANLPSCAGTVQGDRIEATRVQKDGTIFAGGRSIHLEGILLPAGSADHAPDQLAAKAIAQIDALVHDRPITIAANSPVVDRYGRVRAQVFLPDNAAEPWLQIALLKKGLARVDFAPDRRECAHELLAAEAEARKAKAGLWSYPAYMVRSPNNLARYLGTFQVVEGNVVRADIRGSRGYLDFGPDWHTDFTVTISPDDMETFRAAAVDPRGFQGKRVRVRGWVEERDGPEMEIAAPESIETIGDK